MKIHTININLTSVVSDEPEETVPCNTCILCCEKLSPFLSPEEIASGLYPISLIEPTIAQKKLNEDSGPTVVLYRNKTGGCGMLVNGKCSIYDYRPKACKQFDCRKGHHPNIPNMIDK